MARKRKSIPSLKNKPKRKPAEPLEVEYLLETGTLDSMRAAKKRVQDLLDYQWAYYSELANQRNKKIEEIKQALISSSISDFPFKRWQRS